MKGGYLRISGFERYIYDIYLIQSREIDVKLCQNYTKSIILLRIVCTVGYYVTKTSANGSVVYWSHVSRDNDTALLLAEVLVT